MPTDNKVSKRPRRPYEKERLDAELKLVGEFGLKNKRELYRVNVALSKIRKAARILLTLPEKDSRRIFQASHPRWRRIVRPVFCEKPLPSHSAGQCPSAAHDALRPAG